jgi:hypothetical protein
LYSSESEAKGMNETYNFPFGKPLKRVEQKDQTPKKAFVLGVYASAVHARWVDKEGKQKVAALAVASEPEIFWRGENAEEIISKIVIDKQLGHLQVPTNPLLNGPSGRALDEKFLEPLRLDRSSTWLCDLLPESRVNEKQRAAIDKHYSKEIIQKFGLPPATIRDFKKEELKVNSKLRCEEILEELETSQAETLILLGDLPIYWFLRFHDKRFSRLAQFGESNLTYGRAHEISINNKIFKVIPLCHPRQAARLGSSSDKWGNLHEQWVKEKTSTQDMY